MSVDMFHRWHVTQPPGSGYHVLWWGNRVMAQGPHEVLRMNPGYQYRSK